MQAEHVIAEIRPLSRGPKLLGPRQEARLRMSILNLLAEVQERF